MASSAPVYTLCLLLVCICSLHTAVMGTFTSNCDCDICFTDYRQEIRGGPNATVLITAGPNPAAFGSEIVYDNFLKQGTSASSTLLGEITGLAAVTTKNFPSVYTAFDHAYGPNSPYNGSKLTVIGFVNFTSPPYVLIVPGGTGKFRGYTGTVTGNDVPSAAVGAAGTPGQLVVSSWAFCLFAPCSINLNRCNLNNGLQLP